MYGDLVPDVFRGQTAKQLLNSPELRALRPVVQIAEFTLTYDMMARQSMVDDVGSAEFCRVLTEWYMERCPNNLVEFILTHANTMPDERIVLVEDDGAFWETCAEFIVDDSPFFTESE